MPPAMGRHHTVLFQGRLSSVQAARPLHCEQPTRGCDMQVRIAGRWSLHLTSFSTQTTNLTLSPNLGPAKMLSLIAILTRRFPSVNPHVTLDLALTLPSVDSCPEPQQQARTLSGIQFPSRCRLMALPAMSDHVPLVAATRRNRFWTGTTRSVSLPPAASECVFWGPSFAVCGATESRVRVGFGVRVKVR